MALRQEGNVYSSDWALVAHPVRGEMYRRLTSTLNSLTEFVFALFRCYKTWNS